MTTTPRLVRLRLGGLALFLVLMTVVGLILVTTGGSSDTDAAAGTGSATRDEPSPSRDAGTTSRTSGGGRGVDMRVSVTPEGDFDVHETVRLDRPTRLVQLAAPDLGEASPTLRGLTPEASTVQMSADDEVVALDPDTVTAETQSVQFDSPVESYTLHYLLEGAALYSATSTPGRALGALAPLSRALSPDLPVRMTFADTDILNVTCPLLPGAEQVCSRAGADDTYVVDGLRVRDSVTLLQVELD